MMEEKYDNDIFSAQKFVKTDLENSHPKGIKAVMMVRTAAQGARPQNCQSRRVPRSKSHHSSGWQEMPYYEQYTAVHLATSPGAGQQVTLTKIDLIK